MSFMRGIRRAVSSSSSLPLHRCYSVRSSSSAVSSFSAPRGFEWRKLVTPHISPQAIEAFREIEASVAKLASDVASTPAAPPAIDWDKWTKTIKTKGSVAELKKQYETTLASIAVAEKASTEKKPVEIEEFNGEFDKIIAQAESIAKVSEQEAEKLRKAVKELEQWDASIGDGIVPMGEYFQRYPGLKERLFEEYDNGEFVLTEAEQRLSATDINSLKQLLQNGGDIDVGGIVPADRFGDFKPTEASQGMKDWLKNVYGDLAKDEEVLEFEFDTDPYADEVADDHH